MKSIILKKLTAPRPVIVSVDDALAKPAATDAEALKSFDAAWAKYLETYDRDGLPIRPGCAPVVFMVAPLASVGLVAHVENSIGRFGEHELEMIAYSVVDILNLVDEKNKPVAVVREKTPLGLRLPDDILMIFADDDVRREVYAHCRKANQLDAEVVKSSQE